jgi:hypothetical protein
MPRLAIASLLACVPLFVSVAAHAATVDAKCAGKVAFQFDDEKWETDKDVTKAPLCDFVFTSRQDRGFSVFFWSPTLKPKEAKQVKKTSAAGLLQRMVDMVSGGNEGAKVVATEKAGDFDWVFQRTSGPSGNPTEQYFGVTRKAGVLLYVVYGFEAHRSDNKVPYDQAAAKAEFERWLAGVKIGRGKKEQVDRPSPHEAALHGEAPQWVRVETERPYRRACGNSSGGSGCGPAGAAGWCVTAQGF